MMGRWQFMWFLLGMLIGTIAGCLTCIRYLRREIAADIGPRLRRIEIQLDNLETALNLAMVTRYADIAEGLPRWLPVPPQAVVPPRPHASKPPFAA
jgi:hypothetical protein